MGHVKVYSCIKFEVSSFTNYKFTEGVLKFNNLASGVDPDHVPFAGISSPMRWDFQRSIRVPNLKFLTSPIPKICNGWMREVVCPN